MASRQREFVNRVYNEARSAGLADPQARLAAAQAALETGYGSSSVGNNYFGIKAGSSWNGPSVVSGTWEDYGNGPVNERAAFRAYDNPAQSFQDWQSTVGRRWGSALSAPTLSDAVENLNYGKPGGYASDRGYGNKIRAIDRMYGPSAMELGFDAPTPSSRPPDIQGILNSGYTAPVTSVQRSALQAPSTLDSFDSGRFAGPVNMQTVPELSYDRFSTTPFDAARFGPVTTTGKTTNQLRRELLDQQLDAGVLPDLSNPAYAAMTPPVSSPLVAGQTTVGAPSIKTAAVQAPERPVQNSLLSPQEAQAVAAQKSYLESLPQNRSASLNAKNILGTVGGALLGGLTLGPVGGILGGLVGNTVVRNNLLSSPEKRFPDAPKSRSFGDGSLTSYGRSVANSSGQFSSALSSGKAGLW